MVEVCWPFKTNTLNSILNGNLKLAQIITTVFIKIYNVNLFLLLILINYLFTIDTILFDALYMTM